MPGAAGAAPRLDSGTVNSSLPLASCLGLIGSVGFDRALGGYGGLGFHGSVGIECGLGFSGRLG